MSGSNANILLIGDITPQTVANISITLFDAAYRIGQHSMNLIFMGHGGDGDSCIALVDCIRQVQAVGLQVRGTVLGYAMSADALVLQACAVRAMSRYGHLMLHGATYNYMGFDQADMRAYKQHENHNETRFRELLMRSNMTLQEIDHLFDVNVPVWYDAGEAMRAGLIDVVIEA